ncbi:MAG: hypothetical protein AAB426_05695 [Myxococcota bacterium]
MLSSGELVLFALIVVTVLTAARLGRLGDALGRVLTRLRRPR